MRFRMLFLRSMPIVVVGVLLTTVALTARTLPPAAPSTPDQEAAIDEAISSVSAEKYNDAIAKFREVLAENPRNVRALYELALAYRIAGQVDSCIYVAARGTVLQSPNWEDFYGLIGDVFLEQRKYSDMVGLFRDGLSVDSTNAYMWYQLGETYGRMAQLDEALHCFKRTVWYTPDNASAHILIGRIWSYGRYRVPALLAMSRYLVLESYGQRPKEGLRFIWENFLLDQTEIDTTPAARMLAWRGVELRPAKPSVDYLSPANDTRTLEGDFNKAAVVLDYFDRARPPVYSFRSHVQRVIMTMDKMIAALPDPASSQGFAADYYVPYFRGLRAAGHLETFCYYIMRGASDDLVSDWVNNNTERINKFLAWDAAFNWQAAGAMK